MCNASVVLPLDSGPKISTTRPRGTPPTPRARSSPSDPVEMAGDLHRGGIVAQAHDRALAVLTLDLQDRHLQGLVLFHRCLLCPLLASPRPKRRAADDRVHTLPRASSSLSVEAHRLYRKQRLPALIPWSHGRRGAQPGDGQVRAERPLLSLHDPAGLEPIHDPFEQRAKHPSARRPARVPPPAPSTSREEAGSALWSPRRPCRRDRPSTTFRRPLRPSPAPTSPMKARVTCNCPA